MKRLVEVFRYIQLHPGLTQRAISRAMEMHSTTVSRRIKALKELGLVTAKKNGRSSWVEATDNQKTGGKPK